MISFQTLNVIFILYLLRYKTNITFNSALLNMSIDSANSVECFVISNFNFDYRNFNCNTTIIFTKKIETDIITLTLARVCLC